jgi:hypothetical protein
MILLRTIDGKKHEPDYIWLKDRIGFQITMKKEDYHDWKVNILEMTAEHEPFTHLVAKVWVERSGNSDITRSRIYDDIIGFSYMEEASESQKKEMETC